MLELRRTGWGLIPREFRELEDTERHFDWFGWRQLPSLWTRIPDETYYWRPAIDLYEKDDKYFVRAELPGMAKDDIDVSVTDNILTIKGERKDDTKVEEGGYYCREQTFGTYYRTFELPSTVDEKKIEATYENGILEVVIPKTPAVLPKKIAVSSRKKELKSETKTE